jgi:uncharacterized protein
MRTRFMMTGFIALCLMGGGPAAAQPATPPTQDALAAARELVQVARATDQLKLILPSIIQALKPAVVQGRPEVEKDFDAFAPALLDNMNARLPEFAAEIVLIYARNFTPEEMRQMTTFYRTPVGQKLLEKLPTVTQESMRVGQAWGQRIGAEVQNRMIEELRKKGHNI